MKILIVDFDVFDVRGGGQTVYANLIRRQPEHQFYFFRRGTAGIEQLAANIVAIGYQEHYRSNDLGLPTGLGGFYLRYLLACQFAASVKAALGPTRFDVVDIPDYTTDAVFIREALVAHGIDVGVVALAMHGTISNAFRGDWAPNSVSQNTLNSVLVYERLQYRLADVRYAISEAYADLWACGTGHRARIVSPLHIVGPFLPEFASPATSSVEKPDLIYIGRRERLKGADIAIDLAWAVGRDHFRSLRIVGSDSSGVTGTTSGTALGKALKLRRLEAEISHSVPFAELVTLFKARTVVLLPSRIDTFNLVALEALRLGCPVFVSRQAGASRWIESNYPELSDLVIDLGCGREAAARLRRALDDYDGLRERILRAIADRPLQPSAVDLAQMYVPIDGGDDALRRRFGELAQRFQAENAPLAVNATRLELPTAGSPAGEAPSAKEPVDVPDHLRASARIHLAATANYAQGLAGVLRTTPNSTQELAGFIDFLNGAVMGHRAARVAIFDRLAQLERWRGNHLTAALYDLRVMRWLKRDAFGRLASVKDAFAGEGFKRDAEVAEAMYGDPASAHDRCGQLIREQFARLREVPARPLEILDDRRGGQPPRVSVIVSLYNAHAKLPALLENVAIQSLARDGAVEVVLVDSGSPAQEYAVFKQQAERYDLPIVFGRSKDRETIQAAWNRGIKLARAPYLCFYGVDEGMHPDCLEILAQTLDARPNVDWVMADSIVTEVDTEGIFAHDVMDYDREGLDHGMAYLDTSYLSWVGGLYRRSIHERFGYYDESFRAAGDTEFKGRILGRIQILHVTRPLGVFNNYPEERTTQHPRAEIEDQRAWYLHRSSAGLANLFDSRPVTDAEALVRRCFAYRKSYCRHISTDFDLAEAAVGYMTGRAENPDFVESVNASLPQILASIEQVETVGLASPVAEKQAVLLRAFETLRAQEPILARALELDSEPLFELFNDNRFEQHWWSWSR